MARQLPLLMQNLFNTPLALSERKAEMVVAALAGRLDIQALTTETAVYDQAALAGMAARGRDDVERERSLRAVKMSAGPEGPMIIDPMNWSFDAWMRGKPYPLTSSGIAMIDVRGTLTRTWGCDPFSGATGYDGIWTKLAYALDDPDCKGIWLGINSGGGAVDGLFDLADAIYQVSARNGGKPIWAFAGDYAFSAAYCLGAACDRLFTSPLGGVGSIGCIAIWIDMTEAMAEEGLKAVIWRSAERKAIGIGGIESMDQTEIDKVQGQIDAAGDYFEERVAMYRAGSVSKSAIHGTRGNDYTATQAKAIGLIDGILRQQDAWAEFERELAQ
ncbi:MAG: S49 family peptidase [Sphingomonas sp.]|nr:S49 family peptidase [Sphingomonas sp.]